MNGYDMMAFVWYEALDTLLPIAYTMSAICRWKWLDPTVRSGKGGAGGQSTVYL